MGCISEGKEAEYVGIVDNGFGCVVSSEGRKHPYMNCEGLVLGVQLDS